MTKGTLDLLKKDWELIILEYFCKELYKYFQSYFILF